MPDNYTSTPISSLLAGLDSMSSERGVAGALGVFLTSGLSTTGINYKWEGKIIANRV